MEAYIIWFLIALGLLAAEMATGTFYMLVFAVAFAAGGVVALLGIGLTAQITVSAIVGVIGTIILQRSNVTHAKPAAQQNFDIGQSVRVMRWHENGSLRVAYRGAEWDGEVEADTPRDLSSLYITGMRGSVLLLSQNKP